MSHWTIYIVDMSLSVFVTFLSLVLMGYRKEVKGVVTMICKWQRTLCSITTTVTLILLIHLKVLSITTSQMVRDALEESESHWFPLEAGYLI